MFLSGSVSLWGSKLTILYGVLHGIYHLTRSVHVPVLLEYAVYSRFSVFVLVYGDIQRYSVPSYVMYTELTE